MERTQLDQLAEEVLTQLELEEDTLLSWGITGGTFDAHAKIEQVLYFLPTPFIRELWSSLEEQGITIDQIIENLTERKLLFPGKTGVRSRYAETVRLLYLLKQRFKFNDWHNAPNLVSNIKSNLIYRKYPKRDQKWNQIRSFLENEYTPAFILSVLNELLENGKIQLSSFQIESLSGLLNDTKSADKGTIIGAGTGAGKTKAFYLPAFGKIAFSIKEDQGSWTRMLGIYPRTELLKDQYSEALSEVLKMNSLFDTLLIRRPTIGCYYGDTPNTAEEVRSHANRKWNKKNNAYICPSIACPRCGSDMAWKEDDLVKAIETKEDKYERLYCVNNTCNVEASSDNIILTRNRMKKIQPDVLFTTTEMLNRKLSSGLDQHIFGIRSDCKHPLFVLLDEVHIYNGINGAHVAFVIRRWRNLVKKCSPNYVGIQFVGLSATLPNPQRFFSQLVGVAEHQCKYITPNPSDMTDEGVEYNLVLRGDPFSSTALLSTSVQTAMLLGRMLDPIGPFISRGAYGSKIFGFTDKLDVINRWFHIEKDAEERKVLSQYRDWDTIKNKAPHLISTRVQQFNSGQIWDLAKKIDQFALLNPMKIDITSSQHKGVNTKAKFVVATSTLEVGYNDPDVGAVIQHKAPRNLASFLQRKGRAGRKRGMRPWTLVVTSAYGRDRFVYDYPEQLFSPILPDLNLPLRNVYIQRIQASFAIMDYFSYKLKAYHLHSPIWNVLSPNMNTYKKERRLIADFIIEILNGKDLTNFVSFIKSALQLGETVVDRLLWTPPRSIMLDLLPSLLNHLTMNWGKNLDQAVSLPYSPLQGYVPRNLFSSLEVNELHLIINEDEQNAHYQGLQQGIMEFAPGNISKRYVNQHVTTEAHWLPIPLDGNQVINLTGENIKATFLKEVVKNGEGISVYLPEQYQLRQIPKELSDRSTGFLEWGVEIKPRNEADGAEGSEIKLLDDSALKSFLHRIDLFTSGEHRTVTYTRFAPSVKCELKYRDGNSDRKEYVFRKEQNVSALGFQVEVDALSFTLHNLHPERLQMSSNWKEIVSELRPRFYLYTLQQEPELSRNLSIFEIEWLWQICLSSTIATAIGKRCTLEEAIDYYRAHIIRISERTLEVIFQTTVVKSEEDAEGEQAEEDTKLYKSLRASLNNDSVMAHFITHLDILYKDLTEYDAFYPWIENRVHASVAASIQRAIDLLLPDVNTEDMVIDIHDNKIWLSETDSGGMGVISSIASAITNEPRMFEELFIHAADDCPRSELAKSLSAIVAIDDSELHETFSIIRKSTLLDEQKEQLSILQKQLMGHGITPKRELIISLTTKLLTRNTNEQTDHLLKVIQELWRQEERRLGCKIDIRVFTVACLKVDDIKNQIDTILLSLNPNGKIEDKQRFLLIESLLWNNCNDSCPECLILYSPYQSFEKPSRLLLKSLLVSNKVTIDSSQSNWIETLLNALKQGKQTRLVTSFEKMEKCQKLLIDLVQTPIDMEFEFYYPYIAGVRSSGSNWVFDIQVREVTHG